MWNARVLEDQENLCAVSGQVVFLPRCYPMLDAAMEAWNRSTSGKLTVKREHESKSFGIHFGK